MASELIKPLNIMPAERFEEIGQFLQDKGARGFPYTYDQFAFIQRVFEGLVFEKFIPPSHYSSRVVESLQDDRPDDAKKIDALLKRRKIGWIPGSPGQVIVELSRTKEGDIRYPREKNSKKPGQTVSRLAITALGEIYWFTKRRNDKEIRRERSCFEILKRSRSPQIMMGLYHYLNHLPKTQGPLKQVTISRFSPYGDLFDFLSKNGPISRENICHYQGIVHDLLKALVEFERLGVYHRDGKLGNIIVEKKDDGSFGAKVCDFGSGVTRKSPLYERENVCYSSYCCAPEKASILLKISRRSSMVATTHAADVWSFGHCVIAMIIGGYVFGPYETDDQSLLAIYNTRDPIFIDNPSNPKYKLESDDEEDPYLSCVFHLKTLANAMTCYFPRERMDGRRALQYFEEKISPLIERLKNMQDSQEEKS